MNIVSARVAFFETNLKEVPVLKGAKLNRNRVYLISDLLYVAFCNDKVFL